LWRTAFGQSTQVTTEQLEFACRRLHIHPVWENARVWGAVYSHRQNCVRYLRDFVLAKLDDPLTTRSSLKQELIALARQVEERGPPEEAGL
jgi:hypothetical protein